MPFGFLDNLFGSEQQTSVRSQRDPWEPAERGLERLTELVGRQARRPLEFFPGQTYAPQTEAERQQIQSYMDAAQAWGQTAMPAWQSMLSAPDVANNPYVTGMAEAIQSQVNRNLMENILPQIDANQIAQGGFGTSGQVARGIASRGTSEVLAEQLANLYGNAYGQGLQAQTQGLGMAPMVMGGAGSLYGQAGGLERAEAQRAIDEEMARFQFGQMEPYQRAQLGMGILMPPGTAFGEGTTNTIQTTAPSPFSSVMNLAGLGSGLIGGFGGMGGFGGFGASPMGYPGIAPGGMTSGAYMPMPYNFAPTFGPYGVGGMRPY